jgi:hypothetical protein
MHVSSSRPSERTAVDPDVQTGGRNSLAERAIATNDLHALQFVVGESRFGHHGNPVAGKTWSASINALKQILVDLLCGSDRQTIWEAAN